MGVSAGQTGWRRAAAPFLLLLVAGCGLWQVAAGVAIPAKAWAAQILLDRAFAASRDAGRPVRPWPWADAAPIARLSVPRLGVEEIVLSGGSGEAMAFGPTLLSGGGSLGERGTAVLAAHRDTHFRWLGRVRPGDLVIVEESSGRTLAYRAEPGRVVRYDGFGVDRHARRPAVALVTCWPLGASDRGPWRYVVTARLETSPQRPAPGSPAP